MSKWKLGLPLLVCAIPLLLYAATLSDNFNFDGTVFALLLRQSLAVGSPFSHLHFQHLLYGPATFLFARLLPMDPLRALQLFGWGVTGLSLFLFASVLSKRSLSLSLRTGATLILGLSFTFWSAGTDAEVHCLSLLFLCLALYLYQSGRERWAALALGLTPLAHVLNLALVAGAAGELLYRKGKRAWHILFRLTLPWALPYGVLTLPSLWRGERPLLLRRTDTSFFHTPGLSTPWQDLLSLGRLFIEGPCAIPFTLLLLLSLLFLFRRRGEGSILLALWLSLSLLFHLFWEPGNPELKSPLVVPLTLGLLSLLSSKKALRPLFLLLPLLLFSLQLPQFWQNHDPANNRDLQRALAIERLTEPESLLLIGGSPKGYQRGKAYVPYFSRRVLLLPETFPGDLTTEEGRLSLRRTLDGIAKSRPLYLLDDLFLGGPLRREEFSSSLEELSDKECLAALAPFRLYRYREKAP